MIFVEDVLIVRLVQPGKSVLNLRDLFSGMLLKPLLKFDFPMFLIVCMEHVEREIS